MFTIIKKKIYISILAIIIIVGIVYFIFYNFTPVWPSNEKILTASGTIKKDCTITKVSETVSGDSMTGLLKNGQKIMILKGYYKCNEVKIDDIIIYPYAGNPIPIVKSVKAIPGDYFELKKDKNGLWNIFINEKITKTSDGIPYALSEPKSKMLAIYVDSYHGIIPADAYIILGNLPEGTIDSTQFGLVNKIDFIGKVE